MRIAVRRGGASTAVGASLLALGAGCGRTDVFLEIDTDHEGTSFSYEDTSDELACGDGVVGPGEDCDDGNQSDADECTSACVWNVCGDGLVFPEYEQCDPGADAIGPGEACVPGCQLNVCGDGFAGPGEQCDDGNEVDGDGCNVDCTIGTCGDFVVDPGEDCDDGNDDNSDACTNACEVASCGDGFVWLGVEECDEAGANADAGDCTASCTVNVCGDGALHASDEECDPGPGMVGPGLDCLDGCVLNGCGDGDQGPDEACDDANGDNSDACTNSCEAASCGDGFVWAGVEECDDQNQDDDDACHNDCTWTEVVQIALGGNHTCALLDHGKLSCWGNGDDGRTGYGTEEILGDDEPAGSFGFVDTGGPITSIVTGITHSCAGYAGGELRCWGQPLRGQLGYGELVTIGDDEVPASVGFVPLGGPVTLLASEGTAFHNCAVLDGGALICWGRETSGQLGYALGDQQQDVGDDETVAQFVAQHGPVEVGGTVTQLALGYAHTCALLDDGTVRCWGEGSSGALGYGSAADIGDDETPASAGPVPIGAPVIAIGAGWQHTCAVLESKEIKCWGKGNEGRLGYGSPAWVGLTNTPAEVGVVDVGGPALSVDGGSAHTCALLDNGELRCWGWGARGQLGYGNVTNIGDNETPASAGAVQIGGAAVNVTVDGAHTCAIRDDGQVLCWGHGAEGRLGYGNEDFVGDDEFPVSVGPVPIL